MSVSVSEERRAFTEWRLKGMPWPPPDCVISAIEGAAREAGVDVNSASDEVIEAGIDALQAFIEAGT